MSIAMLGAGGIASTFAVQLTRAEHELSVLARSKRLAQLERRAGIESASGELIPVSVSAALDQATPWDLVPLSVLAALVEAVLPSLASSAAKRIMFMFNTFEAFEQLQAAVGAQHFALAPLDPRSHRRPGCRAREHSSPRLADNSHRPGTRRHVQRRVSQ